MAQVPGGEKFSSSERQQLDAAMRQAELLSRVEFSLFVGNSEGEPRDFATSLHNTLVAPSRSILIMVDPGRRAIEIVTGGHVRRTLHDHQVELAAVAMQADFANGDLVDGLRRGIAMLAEHARAPQTLHGESGV